MPPTGTPSKLPVTAAAVLVLSLALAGCSGGSSDDQASGGRGGGAVDGSASSAPDTTGDQQPEAPATSVAKVSSNVAARATDVSVDTPVRVRVSEGTFDSVVMRVHKGKEIGGSFNDAKTVWTTSELLEPDTAYVVVSQATDGNGLPMEQRTAFSTIALTLAQQTYARITPLEGETVGVGMPVIVQFDVPVTRHVAFEQKMSVTSTPSQRGSWHWMSDTEAHWRPATYWTPGTTVDVDLAVNSLDAGNGVYGQMDRSMSFDVGQSVVMRANLRTDEMGVFVNGSLARTIPITGGKPGGYETRSGTKLIVEKFESKRMDAATVGIEPGDPEYYNIPRVEYAQRVTFTGEFLHAAPWSVSSQGVENVSHGCVGMSTENAAWLYGLTHRGDPVEVTGTTRGLEEGNGWTDWNQSYAEWKQGSAL